MSAPHGRCYPSNQVFLKLQEPEVMSPDEPNPPEEKTVEWLQYWLYRTSDLRFIPDPRLVDYVAEYKRCLRKEGVFRKNQKDLMEMLFPTRYWTENGVRYKQKVSTEQVTREELKAMNLGLTEQQEYRQSQFTSKYCPIRFGLHMDMFDELLRQVALIDSMRAFLLERVRGELFMTLDAYWKCTEVNLAEVGKMLGDGSDTPEVMRLKQKLNEVETELASVLEANENVRSDLKEVEDKWDLMETMQEQVHEPEIEFTKDLGKALERQLWHFENPPTYDTGEEEEETTATAETPTTAAATTTTATAVATTTGATALTTTTAATTTAAAKKSTETTPETRKSTETTSEPRKSAETTSEARKSAETTEAKLSTS